MSKARRTNPDSPWWKSVKLYQPGERYGFRWGPRRDVMVLTPRQRIERLREQMSQEEE